MDIRDSGTNGLVFGGYTAEQLARQYDNRAAVPEHDRCFARWRSDSEAARRGYAVCQDVAYGAGPRETMDVFPASSRHAPVAVFIHGGYWQAFDKSYFSFVAPPLVDMGFAVVVLNYPICPAVALQDIVHSVRWAMIYLYRNIERYGGDRERLCVAGYCAGAHLAAMLMATSWSRLDTVLDDGLVRRVVCISGLFELEPLRHTSVNQALKLDRSGAAGLSPVLCRPPRCGRLDLCVGGAESDEYHRQSHALVEAWAGDGIETHEHVLPQHDHFSVLDEMVEPGGVILGLIAGAPPP